MLLSKKAVRGLVSTTVAAAALAVPAVSSASTPVPPLQAGDTQAYASLTAGGPAITSPIVRTYNGSITMNYTPNANTCQATLTSTVNPDGTLAVAQATFTPVIHCGSSSYPGCFATMAASSGTPGLPWGGRLVRDSGGTFRLRINVQRFTVTYAGSCGPTLLTGFPYSLGGVVSPQLTSASTRATITLTSTSGRLAFDLGYTGIHPYWSGTLQTPVGQPLFGVV
jgi:hypothetical protein